ncbi:helix-turn-helix transcriptional regulator [Subtercola lobariae]|uniref:Helix-turn-helix transcriptional regulator n=1 Tax=Subtercola lobariae TaxID=1588641 RepID=A0A917BAY8_9MICO|nr:helix-turn-helix transcriptional regulator [Subtercola lobariae]GGF34629.1 helix-turn-helix transcriptional regulator [Subtercola lobariae]
MQSVSSELLVGRESDLELLVSALGEALGGQTRTVLLGGEAGIGKTRLVDEFLRRPLALESGALVLRGQSIDLDRDAPPYAPVVSVLRGLVAAVGAETALEAAGPARDALAVLLPELSAEQGADVDRSRREGAERLFDAVAGVFEGVAGEHPLVVIIEDVHWADHATLALLRFLVRMLDGARVLFVFTFRSDEVGRGSALRAWLPELDRNRRVERRELPRLSRREVRALATCIHGSALDVRDTDIIFERTEGVPFFVEELVGCETFVGADSFPETLRGILLARYELLSDHAQGLVRLISAGGVRVDHELLAEVCPHTADEIDLAVREAMAAGVLVVDDTAYAFRHALVREAVHDQLLPGERVRFHTTYAEALESGQTASSSDATAISYHWMIAHNSARAFASSIAAMGQARNSYAFLTAARMGERALELWNEVADPERVAGQTRVQLLAETSYILRNAGESERAIALIDEALNEVQASESGPSGHAEQYARMLRDKASYLANVGHVGSIALLRQALDVIHLRPRSVLRANILGELAARLMLDARFAEAIETADRAFAEASAVDSKPRMSVAANIRGISKFGFGDIDDGLADLALAGRLAEGNDSARLRYWVNQSDALNLLGRFGDAVATAEEGAERARQRGVERTSGIMLLSNVISPLFSLGETARANEMLERALDLDPPIGFSAHLQRLKLQSVLAGGDVAEAERLLRGWRSGLRLQLRIDVQSRLGFALVAGEIALARGDVRQAWAEVSALLAAEHRSYPAYDLPLLQAAARTLAAARVTGLQLPSLEESTRGPGGAGAPTGHPGAADPSGPGFAADPTGPGLVADPTAPGGELETALRAVLADSAAWPTAAPFAAVFEAELGGPRGTGTDAELWMLAVTACETPTTGARLAQWAMVRAAEAFANGGDRASARLWAQKARVAASSIGFVWVVDRVVELERRVGAIAASAASATSAAAGGSGSLGRTGSGSNGTGSGAAAPAPADGGSAAALLTDRERQVLDLLERGLTNKQIAEQLFISVKTASVHVSNILRKTGATSRTEAAYLARSFAASSSP